MRRDHADPLARRDAIVVVNLPDEVLVYDQTRRRAHCLNSTAAFIWKQCDGRTSIATIARKLAAHTGAMADDAVVKLALAELGRERLLVEPAGRRATGPGVNRREVLKRAGLAAAITVPLVTSVIVPAAAQAASCQPTGGPCIEHSDCCSGLCSSSTGQPPGGTCLQANSDRRLKEHFAPVEARAILARVAALPIESWNYKGQDPAIRHVGPMAQDFAALFGVGEDDRHINLLDASGVALAAIQGLHGLLRTQAAELQVLSRELKALQAKPGARPAPRGGRRHPARARARSGFGS